jgi:hypothetical protein
MSNAVVLSALAYPHIVEGSGLSFLLVKAIGLARLS